MRALARRIRHEEVGLSIVELSVAIILFGIVLSMVWGFYAAANSAYTSNSARSSNTAVASNVMDEVARYIRAATQNPVQNQSVPSPAFVTAANETVIVYAYVNLTGSSEVPVQASFSLDAKRNVIEKLWTGTAVSGASGYWSFPATTSTPTSTRNLGGPVAPQSGTNPYLFTYIGSDGSTIAVPTNGFTSTQLQSIAAVQVTITVASNASGAGNPITIQNTVGLPNTGIARTQ